MYTSLNGKERKPNLENFLNIYYTSFKSVLQLGDHEFPFTEAQLKEEYHNKNLFGFCMAVMLMPLVLQEEKYLDLDACTDDNLDQIMDEHRNNVLGMLEKNSLIRPRFLDMYDEMIEYGAIGMDISKI